MRPGGFGVEPAGGWQAGANPWHGWVAAAVKQACVCSSCVSCVRGGFLWPHQYGREAVGAWVPIMPRPLPIVAPGGGVLRRARRGQDPDRVRGLGTGLRCRWDSARGRGQTELFRSFCSLSLLCLLCLLCMPQPLLVPPLGHSVNDLIYYLLWRMKEPEWPGKVCCSVALGASVQASQFNRSLQLVRTTGCSWLWMSRSHRCLEARGAGQCT